ncbi:MAG: hypothetical protein NTZ94_14280, partial [Verrucomicrobia bacterium]|nr:hypothetical protein [Verrucomicrobiota bacterium]
RNQENKLQAAQKKLIPVVGARSVHKINSVRLYSIMSATGANNVSICMEAKPTHDGQSFLGRAS